MRADPEVAILYQSYTDDKPPPASNHSNSYVATSSTKPSQAGVTSTVGKHCAAFSRYMYPSALPRPQRLIVYWMQRPLHSLRFEGDDSSGALEHMTEYGGAYNIKAACYVLFTRLAPSEEDKAIMVSLGLVPEYSYCGHMWTAFPILEGLAVYAVRRSHLIPRCIGKRKFTRVPLDMHAIHAKVLEELSNALFCLESQLQMRVSLQNKRKRRGKRRRHRKRRTNRYPWVRSCTAQRITPTGRCKFLCWLRH